MADDGMTDEPGLWAGVTFEEPDEEPKEGRREFPILLPMILVVAVSFFSWLSRELGVGLMTWGKFLRSLGLA